MLNIHTKKYFPDDRKVPNAYFGMAQCYLMRSNIAVAVENYNIGCEKGNSHIQQCFVPTITTAKRLLPFFHDQATLKEEVYRAIELAKTVQQVKEGKKPSLDEFLSKLPNQNAANNVNPQTDAYEKFNSTRRIEVITRHRESQNSKKKVSATDQSVSTTTAPLKRQPALSSLANLKSLSVEDMDLCKDQVYKGYLFHNLRHFNSLLIVL